MRAIPISLLFGMFVLTASGCRKQETRPEPPPPELPKQAPNPLSPTTPLPPPPPSAPGAQRPPAGQPIGADAAQTVEVCVDRWLQAHGYDRYGHPEGTMYTGGTPLFDERTGETRDRIEYVFARHPQARAACAPGTAPADAGLPTK